ncbi:MAG: hypothetical protein M3371_13310 [Acidobacteriota bacterium]|nr:hypothetical protein [Acidobacteriota bacterium]
MSIISEGFITGGVECIVQWQDGSRQAETVFDVVSWIRSQFLTLLEASKERHQAGEKKALSMCVIWIGSDQVFATLETTLSRFRAYYIHPTYLSQPGFCLDSSNLDKVCADVASRALKVIRVD